ncbi:MAG: pyrroline-5-carboxylate reductase [Clostridia bacterium]|nr:pyrroline-5-carboxylate reductase [Clostridia bacterium]MBP3705741.1 pyrroline-5-carboxylate reductase [Clostridia bacterium]
MTFGFIGVGNMGGALCEAVCKTVDKTNILISDYNSNKAAAFAKTLGVVNADNETIAQNCDFIVLGVKPQVMEKVLDSISSELNMRKSPFTLISMAAGLSTDSIKQMAKCDCPVIRIMPNTPVKHGEGMILYTLNGVSKNNCEQFVYAFKESGKLEFIDEKLIDAASAVSGCGPAFCFMFMDALASGGVECGLPYNTALTLAAQTLLGSAKTVLESDEHPEALKTAVCSPGGTTIEGVHALEAGAFKATSMNAVKESYKKTLRLAGK